MRAALSQLNLRVGDLQGNKKKILSALAEAEVAECDIILFPELAITSYPPEDLLLKQSFIADNLAVLAEIASATKKCTAFVGFAMTGAIDPELELLKKQVRSDEARWPGLYNAVAVLAGGVEVGQILKSHLPNYAVFDEHRYFAEGKPFEPIDIAGARIGAVICEDLWVEGAAVKNLRGNPIDLLVHLNASPYYSGKQADRLKLIQYRAKEFNCTLAYVNLVGGQDELVFDGGSVVVSKEGEILAQAPQFEEALLIIDLDLGSNLSGEESSSRAEKSNKPKNNKPKNHIATELGRSEEIYKALVLGTQDYVYKNGFTDVLIGISGGIDSALVAAVAAEALGPEHVHGVAMPSRFSSTESFHDAEALAKNLGIELRQISIEKAHTAFLSMLDPYMGADASSQLAAENIQARIRGALLMALSNIYGWLVLTTGNKSENSVGYSTLYGDTAGAFAVIKDLWKQEVYGLAQMLNDQAGREIIPENIFIKPPTAELRPNQRDDQSLPPYEDLDPILKSLVEEDLTPLQVLDGAPDKTGKNLDLEFVESISRLLDRAEYKRRQVPPGIRISSKAFGKDRRLPITNFYL